MSLGTDLRFLFALDMPLLIGFDRMLGAYRITLGTEPGRVVVEDKPEEAWSEALAHLFSVKRDKTVDGTSLAIIALATGQRRRGSACADASWTVRSLADAGARVEIGRGATSYRPSARVRWERGGFHVYERPPMRLLEPIALSAAALEPVKTRFVPPEVRAIDIDPPNLDHAQLADTWCRAVMQVTPSTSLARP